MSGITMTVTGLKEITDAVKSSREGIPSAIYVAMAAGGMQIRNRVATYPTQKPPRNPQRVYIRGIGTRYTRKDGKARTYRTSERYGASTVYRVMRDGENVVMFVNSKASYSNWLRGTLARMHEQADQHSNWETLVEIVNAEKPLLETRINVAVTNYMKRAGL